MHEYEIHWPINRIPIAPLVDHSINMSTHEYLHEIYDDFLHMYENEQFYCLLISHNMSHEESNAYKGELSEIGMRLFIALYEANTAVLKHFYKVGYVNTGFPDSVERKLLAYEKIIAKLRDRAESLLLDQGLNGL